MRERERERERVANYLKLPNKSTTFLQGNSFFPVQCIHLYNIRNIAVNYDVKSAILSEFRIFSKVKKRFRIKKRNARYFAFFIDRHFNTSYGYENVDQRCPYD